MVGKYKLKSRLCHHFLTKKVVLLSYNYETIRQVRNISLYKREKETTHDTELVFNSRCGWLTKMVTLKS